MKALHQGTISKGDAGNMVAIWLDKELTALENKKAVNPPGLRLTFDAPLHWGEEANRIRSKWWRAVNNLIEGQSRPNSQQLTKPKAFNKKSKSKDNKTCGHSEDNKENIGAADGSYGLITSKEDDSEHSVVIDQETSSPDRDKVKWVSMLSTTEALASPHTVTTAGEISDSYSEPDNHMNVCSICGNDGTLHCCSAISCNQVLCQRCCKSKDLLEMHRVKSFMSKTLGLLCSSFFCPDCILQVDSWNSGECGTAE